MIYIWMPEGLGEWRWTDAQGEGWRSEPSLERLTAAIRSQYSTPPLVVAFVPVALHQCLQADLNRSQARQLGEQGLKYLAEEYTLIPVDDLNVRTWFEQDQKASLLLSSTSVIRNYISLLQTPVWKLQAIVPDAYMLPVFEQTEATICPVSPAKPGLFLLQTTPLHGGYLVDDWAVVLPRLAGITTLATLGEPDVATLTLFRQQNIHVRPEPLSRLWQSLKSTQWAQHPFNLLPRQKNRRNNTVWIGVAVMLVVVVLLYVAQQLMAGYQYQKAATAITEQNRQQYLQWFPQEQRVQDIRRQLRSHMKSGTSDGSGAVELLGRVAPLMQQNGISATEVQYAPGQLKLVVNAPGSQALDNFRQQLEGQGFKTVISSNKTPDGRLTATVEITP